MSKSIDEVFNEKYPQLAKQLEELGITDTDKLVERFQSNGKYLNEVLEYDLKDNEKIRSIAENHSKQKKEEPQAVSLSIHDQDTDWKGMGIGIVIMLILSWFFLFKPA